MQVGIIAKDQIKATVFILIIIKTSMINPVDTLGEILFLCSLPIEFVLFFTDV